MTVFCPGCGTRISAAPTPLDGEGVVTCPKCHSQFPTAGVKADPGRFEPKRKFRAKKQSSGVGRALAVTAGVIVLLGGVAYSLWYLGWIPWAPRSITTTTSIPGNSTAWREFPSAEGKFKVLLPGAPV